MATVVEVRTCEEADNPAEWSEVGKCSNCKGFLIYQPNHGFPVHCPYCEELLDNGTDDRLFIKRFYVQKNAIKI